MTIENLISEWESKAPDEKIESLESAGADLLNSLGDARRENRRMRTENDDLQKALRDYQRQCRRDRIENRVQWVLIVVGLLLWLMS